MSNFENNYYITLEVELPLNSLLASEAFPFAEMYVNDLKSETTMSDKEPTIICEKSATAYIDGENLLGPVVGNFAMQLAIQKAKEAGVGMVTAKG